MQAIVSCNDFSYAYPSASRLALLDLNFEILPGSFNVICGPSGAGKSTFLKILTGEIEFNADSKTSNKVIGYAAYFRLINGFEKTLYMTSEQVEKHAKQYSKMYNHETSLWKKDFEKMALKTVLKLLLSKYGILSVDMQVALKTDQAVINDVEGAEIDYIDAEDAEIINS